MDLDTMADDPQPGDRWQHDKWPPGTPDAVVSEVYREGGCVELAGLGGAQLRYMMLRFMTPSRGWRKQPRSTM